MKLKDINVKNNIYYINNSQYYNELLELITHYPKHYCRKLNSKCSKKKYKNYQHLCLWINEMLPKLQDPIYNYSTKCYWIIYGLQDFPKCNVCCKNDNYKNINVWSIFTGYSQCCSYDCMYKSENWNTKQNMAIINNLKNNINYFKERYKKASNTYKQKTGYDNPSKNPNIINKKKESYYKHYGVDNNMKSEIGINEYKNAIFKKYGVYSVFELDSTKEKTIITNQKRLSCDYPMQNQECVEKSRKTRYEQNNGKFISEQSLKKSSDTYFSKTGYRNPFLNPEVQNNIKNKQKQSLQKAIETKKKNGTFNTSKLENKIYIKMLEYFQQDEICRQYSEKRYPFPCDFYIKNIDLFIEINGTWTHGGHTFDEKSIEDQRKLIYWKQKSLSSLYYKNAIKVWTQRDIQKKKYAELNNLNYIIFWNYNQFELWIKSMDNNNNLQV